MSRAIASLIAALAVVPSAVLAQGGPRAAEPSAPSGIVVTADLGGGGSIGAGSQYTKSGVFENEIGVGYELPWGLRPEFDLVLGLAPTGNVALRPGLHYALPDVPFYVRAALDWSTVRGAGGWRWLLAGGGAELRLTDVLGGFVEADLGIPLASEVGVGTLVRAGVSLRF